MKKIHIDIETFSDEDLTKVGVHKYALSNSFKVLLISYYIGDYSEYVNEDDIETIDLVFNHNPAKLDKFLGYLTDPEYIKCAHNALFEYTCLKIYFGLALDIKQWKCSMVKAYSAGLPGKLEKLAEVLNLVNQKMPGLDMQYFCKPFKGEMRNPLNNLHRWNRLIEYNKVDVLIEMELDSRIPYGYEDELWHLHTKILERGIRLDIPFIKGLIGFQKEKINRLLDIGKKYDINLMSPTQLMEHLKIHNLPCVSTDLDSIKLILGLSLPEYLREVLKARVELSETSSTKKLNTMIASSVDGRVYDHMAFYGSGTGRWAGRGIQVQNLPRSKLPDKDIEIIRDLTLWGSDPAFIYPDNYIKSCLRSCLIADEGKEFTVCDFSAIEARVLAWLSGQTWLLNAFRNGEDIYISQAMKMYNLPYEEAKELRSTGKIATLALGYQGSVGALKSMGYSGTDEEAMAIVMKWRRANSIICEFWRNVQISFMDAVNGQPKRLGHVLFRRDGEYMLIYLPAGRSLKYFRPEVNNGKISYMRVNSKTKKWEHCESFGGLLTENITQAVARDLLVESLVAIENAGGEVIFHVHDEIISQNISLENMKKIMSKSPNWAKNLPMDCDGYTSKFYKKA